MKQKIEKNFACRDLKVNLPKFFHVLKINESFNSINPHFFLENKKKMKKTLEFLLKDQKSHAMKNKQ